MITVNVGAYANPAANTWGNSGLTIVVPSGHVFIGVLWTAYSSGRPTGIGVDESTTPSGSIPNQSAESSNGQYGVNVFLWPGTWHVFDKRATAAVANNNFYFRYIDLS